MMLIKIGDFAKMTGVSIKALRHYEKLGLVKPSWKNRFNGYRFYSPEQQETVGMLLAYKQLGFSLKQIAKLLDPAIDDSTLKSLLSERLNALESRIRDDSARKAKLDVCLSEIEAGAGIAGLMNILEIQKPYNLKSQQEIKMEIQTKKLEAFTIVCLCYQGNNKHDEIVDTWTAFNKRTHEIKNIAGNESFGICSIPDGLPEGEFEYICGLPVSQPVDIPAGMLIRSFPALEAAVFEHHGNHAGLSKTYSDIYQKWLPEAGLQPLENGFDLEVYDDKFKNFAPDSVMYIYVPLSAA